MYEVELNEMIRHKDGLVRVSEPRGRGKSGTVVETISDQISDASLCMYSSTRQV